MKLISVEICHDSNSAHGLKNMLAGLCGEVMEGNLAQANKSSGLAQVRVPLLVANSLYSGPLLLRNVSQESGEVFRQTSFALPSKMLRPVPERIPVSCYEREAYAGDIPKTFSSSSGRYLYLKGVKRLRSLLATMRKDGYGYCAVLASQLPKTSGRLLLVEARLYPGRTVLPSYISGTGSLAMQLIFRPTQEKTPDTSVYSEPLDQMVTYLFADREETVCYVDGTNIHREQVINWPDTLEKVLVRFSKSANS